MDQNPWHVSPPQHLAGAIVKNIKREARRRTTLTMSLYGTTALGALAAFIPAYSYMSDEIVRTGFSEFLSLTYSDSALVITNWREMIFTILESLPIVGIVAILILTLAVLGSLRMIAQTSRTNVRIKTL